MRTMVQLTPDKTQVQIRWAWDEQVPLDILFPLQLQELMVDVTGFIPEPQEGWLYSNGVFTNPVAAELPDLLARLETVKQNYIEAHYPSPTREWMIAYCLTATATVAGKTLVQQAWGWVNAVVLPYFFVKQGELLAGKSWEEAAIDFTQFDAVDPKITVFSVIGAS